MGSQTDLDQGGTYRPYQKVSLGNTIGWVQAPAALLMVTTAGTTVLQLGNAVIRVNCNGSVTIQLPQFKGTTTASHAAVPGPFVPVTVTIIDEGGFASANPITILPAAGETISGLSSITISSNYGGVVLQPDPANGSSVVVS